MTAIQSTHQKPLIVQLASGSDHLPHKEWKDMNNAEKILKVLSFGLYSPRFTSAELSTAASLIREFKPVSGFESATWHAVFRDGSAVILSEQKDGKINALIWNTAEATPKFSTHLFTETESNNILQSLERNELNKLNYSSMKTDYGSEFFIENTSQDAFPVYLSISLMKSRLKQSPKIFNQTPAGKLHTALSDSIVKEMNSKTDQMLHAPTTPYSFIGDGERHSHPIVQLWKDIPRSVDQPLILEDVLLPRDAQNIIIKAIIDNPDHIPDNKQRQEIINICGGEDALSEHFKQSLCSQTAMTTIGAVMSQTLIIDSRNMNKPLMESQFQLEYYEPVIASRKRLAEVKASDNGSSSYTARYTITEPLVKVAADKSRIEGGISVSRVELTIDDTIRLPEKDEQSDFMDFPVVYSGDDYWYEASE